jgi:hypothetical protein
MNPQNLEWYQTLISTGLSPQEFGFGRWRLVHAGTLKFVTCNGDIYQQRVPGRCALYPSRVDLGLASWAFNEFSGLLHRKTRQYRSFILWLELSQGLPAD